MHVMKRFTLTLAAMTGLGIAPLTEPRLGFMFSFDTDAPSSRVQERES